MMERLRARLTGPRSSQDHQLERVPSYSTLPAGLAGPIPTVPDFGQASHAHQERIQQMSSSSMTTAMHRMSLAEKEAQQEARHDAEKQALAAREAAREAAAALKQEYDREHDHRLADSATHPALDDFQLKLQKAISDCEHVPWMSIALYERLLVFESLVKELNIILHLRKTLVLHEITEKLSLNVTSINHQLDDLFQAHHGQGCHRVTSDGRLKTLFDETTQAIAHIFGKAYYLFREDHVLSRYPDLARRAHAPVEEQHQMRRLIAEGTRIRLESAVDKLFSVGYLQVSGYFGLMRKYGHSMFVPGAVMSLILAETCWPTSVHCPLTLLSQLRKSGWAYQVDLHQLFIRSTTSSRSNESMSIQPQHMAELMIKSWIAQNPRQHQSHVRHVITQCFDLTFDQLTSGFDIDHIFERIAKVADYICDSNHIELGWQGGGRYLYTVKYSSGSIIRQWNIDENDTATLSVYHSKVSKIHTHGQCHHKYHMVINRAGSSPCHNHHAFDLWHA